MKREQIDWKETYRHCMFCITMLYRIRKIEKQDKSSKTLKVGTLAYDIKCFYYNQAARCLYILRCRAKERGSNTQELFNKYKDIWNQTMVEGHHELIKFSCDIEKYLNCLNEILFLLMPDGMPLNLRIIDDFGTNKSMEVKNKINDLVKIIN